MKLADAKTKLFELAEAPALENRRDSLLELAGALDSDKAHLWAKVDLFAAFGEDSVSVPKADSRDRQIVWFEWARNLLVLVPLVITWLGVWLASREYGELTRMAGEDERLREISTRPFQLVTGRVWKGSAFGGVKGRSELPGIVERYLQGEFKLNDFITHTMGLDDINEAFELMHEGKSIRSVIHFDK